MKRDRFSDKEVTSNDTKTSCDIHPIARDTIGRITLALKKQGMKKGVIHSVLKNAGFDIPKSTLRRWENHINSKGEAFIQDKQTGKQRKVTEEQEHLLVGFVLFQNDSNKEVHLKTICSWFLKHFNLKISETTVHRYLTRNGFSSRVMQSKTSGYRVDYNTLAEIAEKWVQGRIDDGVFEKDRSLLCSIDFTFTSHRTHRRTSYSLKGGPQPKSDQKITTYTNCIVTVLWADGMKRTPPLLFTYDNRFRRDLKSTKKRDEKLKWLDECLEKYNINPDRVIYAGKLKGDTRTYVSESPDLVERFFKHYGLAKGVVIFHDKGKSFLKDKQSIFPDIGFKDHFTYPPAVHQYLSPNDNRYHGIAKTKWRASGIDFSDNVKSSLYLLHCLDQVEETIIRKWWDHNFHLNGKDTLKERMQTLVTSGKDEKLKQSIYYTECLQEYKSWVEQ